MKCRISGAFITLNIMLIWQAKKDNLSVGGAPGKDMPVLHDEYVHVACYNREEMRRDPTSEATGAKASVFSGDNIWEYRGCSWRCNLGWNR